MSEKKKRPDSKRRKKMAKKNMILSIVIAVVAILIIGIAIFFFNKNSEEKTESIATESIDRENENGETQNISIEMGKIDKSWLKKAIKSAEAVDKKDYTKVSYDAMYDNLKKAKKIRRSLFTSEEEINEAFFDLLQSMEELESKKK